MVLKPTLYCDRCGKPAEMGSIPVTLGHTMHPSGNGYEANVESVDLCLSCSRSVLVEMVREMAPAEAANWLDRVKNPKVRRV